MARTGHRSARAVGSVSVAIAMVVTLVPALGAATGPTHEEVLLCRQVQCAGVPRTAHRACIKNCGRPGRCPRIRTLAYVVNQCRTTQDGWWEAQQTLWIRQGNRPPVKVMEFSSGRVRDPFTIANIAAFAPELEGIGSFCQLLGELRSDDAFHLIGNFQRMELTPDGSGLVFEVTGDFAAPKVLRERPQEHLRGGTEFLRNLVAPILAQFEDLVVPPAAPGFYYVRSDGTGLRRLADPSRYPYFEFAIELPVADAEDSPVLLFKVPNDPLFSPNGRRIVYTDTPTPGADPMIMTLEVASGRTRAVRSVPGFSHGIVAFADNDTVVFRKTQEADDRFYRVRIDGSGFREVPVPPVTPAHAILQDFDIAGRGGRTFAVELVDPASSEDMCVASTNRIPYRMPCVREVFVFTQRHVLQLSRFGRSDTTRGFLDRTGRRAVFRGSADPFGTNPTENCQLFSIDALGTRLRELTFFREAARSEQGCSDGRRPGCNVSAVWQDPKIGTVLLASGCDPFRAPAAARTSPTPREFVEAGNFHGLQLFSMQADGSTPCRLTDFAGLTFGADGAVTVELPGPTRYPGLTR